MQYLEERFGKPIRIIASLAFSVQTVLRTALVLYAAALALNAITGVSDTMSMTAVGVLCTFYSTIGGIKAVIFTDLFQVSILILINHYPRDSVRFVYVAKVRP